MASPRSPSTSSTRTVTNPFSPSGTCCCPGSAPATPSRFRHARGLLTAPENTVTSIAKLLGVSRTTLYKYVSELAAGRDSLIP
ncbi:helix-turn-helix domain-containing protein [Streptomyces sp. NPDC051956]|uniref:helix-turn-helix domain-containing protein n=1 Tax=Streptomyces sp. NPDC051956 TaxID=3365677 RepID=UPI0037CF8046